MRITLHKFIITFILILFLIGLFFIRNYINNSMIPERERKINAKINKEIVLIKENYKKELFIDSQQSASYLLSNFENNINFNTSEELKLIYASSMAKIAILSKEKVNIENSTKYFEPLIKSPLAKIKIKALFSMAETIMSYPNLEINNIDSSILLLEKALNVSKEESIINNNLSSFLATTLIEKYSIEKTSKLKFKAIKLLENNIILSDKHNNIDNIADSKINLALLYAKIAKLEQGRANLAKAVKIVEEVKDIITREYNPHKNAKIMRILGDLYYLRTKLPMLQNEAGNRYIQDIIKYKTKSNKAYKKAQQMGFFQDILPGVKELKLEDAKKRKSNKVMIIDDSNGGGPMLSITDEEKK
jgi:hypothetical protein